jgi:DNA polymerase-1
MAEILTRDPIVVCWDCETNSFLLKNRIVHCVSAIILPGDASTVLEFTDADPDYMGLDAFFAVIDQADLIIGHNILSYDMRQLAAIRPGWTYSPNKCVDTLTLARALIPSQRMREIDIEADLIPDEFKNLRGSHSLEAWGHRLDIPKGDFGKGQDWERWSPEMSTYCSQDVRVSWALYEHLMQILADQEAEETDDA